MALIQRPVKTLGNREYAQEKAANPNEPIKSAEVDADLDTIYALVNGQLDTANLKASANIVGSQLAPGANILGSQLSPTANILGSQLSPGSIPPGQLAIGATVRHYGFGATTAGTVSNIEATICTVNIISNGGFIIFGGAWDATVAMPGTVSGTVTIRVKRNGTPVMGLVPTLQGNTITVPLSPPFIIEQPPAATYAYTVTLQTSTAAYGIATTAGGVFFAVELA